MAGGNNKGSGAGLRLRGALWRAALDNDAMCLPRFRAQWPLCFAVIVLSVACSPTLDWREVRPAGSSALLLMPCKPKAQERRLLLAGQPVRMALHACSAGEQTWSLAFADVADPARVGDVLKLLAQTAGANVAAAAAQGQPFVVPGATPNIDSQTVGYEGKLPDGRAVQLRVAVFAHGTHAYQATVLGPALPTEGVQTFLSSIRFAN